MLMKPGRTHALGAFLLAIAASALALSCGVSSGFLSDSERNSLYTLTMNAPDGSALSDGESILPGTGITVNVDKKTGAGDPATLDFNLTGLDGSSSAALHFATPSAKSLEVAASQPSDPSSSSKTVAQIDGKIDGFVIPADLLPGVYQLSVSISGSDGTQLVDETLHLFVGGDVPVIDSVSAFPPAVEPGTAVLLDLTVSWMSVLPPATGTTNAVSTAPSTPKTATSIESPENATVDPKATRDPWIRWSRDGSSFAEGLLSAGFGRVVWSAPQVEGAYGITAEVFPSAPPKGSSFSFKAAESQDLKVMVIAAPGGSGNDFANPLAFYSLLRLDGSFDDIGTRPRTLQPKSFGSPSLDTYSSGFGYRFGDSAGVVVAGLMPPSASGSLGDFSVIMRLSADRSNGILVDFASTDGNYRLVLGLENGSPYVESTSGGKVQRSTGTASIPGSPLTIAARLKPDGDKLDISWSAEGKHIASPPLSLPAAPPEGNATIGGPGSVPGVYDAFGLMVASSPPLYRLAARREWKGALILAEGFENGELPPLSVASGEVTAASGRLIPEPGVSLALSPDFGTSPPVVVEADVEGDLASAAVVFSTSDGTHVFSVRGTGEIDDSSGNRIGNIGAPSGHIAFTLGAKSSSLYLRGSGRKTSVIIPSSAKRIVLSLVRTEGNDGVAFDRVLVRSSSRQ